MKRKYCIPQSKIIVIDYSESIASSSQTTDSDEHNKEVDIEADTEIDIKDDIDEETVFVSDEDHEFISIEEIASIKAQFQRRARKYNTVTISGTQQVRDYCDEKILSYGRAIFENSTYQMYFNMYKSSVEDLSQLIVLTDQEKEQLLNLLVKMNSNIELFNSRTKILSIWNFFFYFFFKINICLPIFLNHWKIIISSF